MANVASGLPFLSGCLLTWFSSPSSMCDAGPLLLPASSVSECPSPQHPPRPHRPLTPVAGHCGCRGTLPSTPSSWAQELPSSGLPSVGCSSSHWGFSPGICRKIVQCFSAPPPRPLVHPYTSRSCMCEPICSRLPEQESLGPGTSLLTKLPPSLGGFITYPSTPRRRDRSPRPLEVP